MPSSRISYKVWQEVKDLPTEKNWASYTKRYFSQRENPPHGYATESARISDSYTKSEKLISIVMLGTMRYLTRKVCIEVVMRIYSQKN